MMADACLQRSDRLITLDDFVKFRFTNFPRFVLAQFRLFVLAATVALCSASGAASSLVTREQVDSALTALDREIERMPASHARKEDRIARLRGELASAQTDARRMALSQNLYDEYRLYQNDSAIVYASRMIELADRAGTPAQRAASRMALLDSYLTVGLFKEAAEIDSEIDAGALSTEKRVGYYEMQARMCQNLESYVARDSKLGVQYAARRTTAYDSIVALSPRGSYARDVALLEREQVYKYLPQLAADTRRQFAARPGLDDHQRAVNYSVLAMAMINLGDRDAAVYYYALSALHDLRGNTRETTAAKDLANMMLDRGEIERANRYIHLALDDATAFNSRLRKIEINQVLPKIEMARYNWINSQRWALVIIVVLVCLLMAVTIVLSLKLKRRNAVLAAAHAEINRKNTALEQNNATLKRLNNELHETTEIKDQYIMQSLYGNTDFVEEVETKCSKAVSRLKTGKYDELGRILNSINIKQERQRMYSAFDSAFLKLFPNFLDEFNKLFDEEHRIGFESDGRLSTEVRIFALLRLGISNPVEVAKYFNISVNTVYVYKTRVKSHARVPKAEFDDYILAIPKL